MRKGERFNTISHLLGAVLAAAGLVVLVVLASVAGDPWRIVGFSVYGTTLVLVYLASTLYHSLHGRAREIFRRLDHISIYLLIAGTYTPFTLVILPRAWGWPIFGVVWGLAAAGALLESVSSRRRPAISIALYLIMGWLCLVAMKPITEHLAPGGLMWLLAGGALYTAGIAAYAWRSLPRGHEIWHLFVLGGSVCHFVSLLLFVA